MVNILNDYVAATVVVVKCKTLFDDASLVLKLSLTEDKNNKQTVKLENHESLRS